MTAQDVIQYVGLPYKEGGFGPDGYNCWGLLSEIQKRHFGIQMPFVPIGDEAKSLEIVKGLLERREWVQVLTPAHGDCVLLREGMNAHVGVFLELDNGGVLHSLEGVGVVYTPKYHLGRLGFSRPKYYTHAR